MKPRELYAAHLRSLGPARLNSEHEQSWETLQPFWIGYWRRMTRFVNRNCAPSEHMDAVLMIDDWAAANASNAPQVQRDPRGGSWTISVQLGDDRVSCTGLTPSAARIAAASTIRAYKRRMKARRK